MTGWFRSWHGAPTDTKWLVVAKKAGTSPGIVSAIVWALLDHASQSEQRGHVGDSFDIETYAEFSGFTEEVIEAVMDALQTKGVLDHNGDFRAWNKRQPKREDDSSERVARYRERHRNNGSGNDASRDVTQGNAPDTDTEQNRTEKKENPPKGGAKKGTRLPPDWVPDEAERAFCREKDLSDAEIDREVVPEFRDYWVSVPGAKGTKLDWPATFRSSVRRFVDRKHQKSGRGPPRKPSAYVV